MLFKLDTKNGNVKKTQKLTLSEIDWTFENMQQFLYENLDKIFPDDELLLIMRSRKWEEEPDLMAIDKNGDLNIFELKKSETEDLQISHYGQIFESKSYEFLNNLFLKFNPFSSDLLIDINKKFSINFRKDQINTSQNFIIITNGTDYKTRQAIIDLSKQGISIKSWIYRLHKIGNNILIEFDKFRFSDKPLEDINENYYNIIINWKKDPEDIEDIINNGKVTIYFRQYSIIKRLKKDDKIFLFKKKFGIVAMGIATGEVDKKVFKNLEYRKYNEYSPKLKEYKKLIKPITASEINEIVGSSVDFTKQVELFNIKTGIKLWQLGNDRIEE